MKRSLLRRMAPLVAGVVLAAQITVGFGDYALITDISWPPAPNDQECTVVVDDDADPPYTAPLDDSENFFWWFNQSRTEGAGSYAPYSDHSRVASVYPGTTNVCVYVYSVDDDLSFAISDRTFGTTIWNGP